MVIYIVYAVCKPLVRGDDFSKACDSRAQESVRLIAILWKIVVGLFLGGGRVRRESTVGLEISAPLSASKRPTVMFLPSGRLVNAGIRV